MIARRGRRSARPLAGAVLCGALIWSVAGAGGSDRAADGRVAARRVPLDAVEGDAVTRDDRGIVVGVMRLESAIVLSGGGIGGLSGLSLDGDELTAVADTGPVWRGRLVRDAAGRLAGVADFHSIDPFAAEKGKSERDAEEIAATPDRRWLVSFERHHRVLVLDHDMVGGRPPAAIPMPAGFAEQPENGGVEAMTVLADGRILMIGEGEDDERPLRPAWLSKPIADARGPDAITSPSDWTALAYERAPGYRPTAATTTPEGDLLVLERHYSPLAGPGARIVRVPAGTISAGAILRGLEMGRLTPPLPVDNFEGIAARRRVEVGGDGLLEVIILSDDNFNPLQSTLMLQLSAP